jgi:hypothetical protein
MSEQKTPGHVLADEAGWHWDSGPQYQEKCESIARAVCAAERERVLERLQQIPRHVVGGELTVGWCDLEDVIHWIAGKP